MCRYVFFSFPTATILSATEMTKLGHNNPFLYTVIYIYIESITIYTTITCHWSILFFSIEHLQSNHVHKLQRERGYPIAHIHNKSIGVQYTIFTVLVHSYWYRPRLYITVVAILSNLLVWLVMFGQSNIQGQQVLKVLHNISVVFKYLDHNQNLK